LQFVRWLLVFWRGYIATVLGWYLPARLYDGYDGTFQKVTVLTFELPSPAIELLAKNTENGW
jgi:hypothetical protein